MFAFAGTENGFLGPTKFENKKIKNLQKDVVAIYTNDLQNRKLIFTLLFHLYNRSVWKGNLKSFWPNFAK